MKAWFEQTPEEAQEEAIREMVAAGVQFSKHLRNCWTGESRRTTVSAANFSGKVRWLRAIARLPGEFLIDWANVADLHDVFYAAAGQYRWGKAEWEKAIRSKLIGS